MSKLEPLIEQLCPDDVETLPLWKITNWNKKFSGVAKHKQEKVIKFKNISAKQLKDLSIRGGISNYFQLDCLMVTQLMKLQKIW